MYVSPWCRGRLHALDGAPRTNPFAERDRDNHAMYNHGYDHDASQYKALTANEREASDAMYGKARQAIADGTATGEGWVTSTGASQTQAARAARTPKRPPIVTDKGAKHDMYLNGLPYECRAVCVERGDDPFVLYKRLRDVGKEAFIASYPPN